MEEYYTKKCYSQNIIEGNVFTDMWIRDNQLDIFRAVHTYCVPESKKCLQRNKAVDYTLKTAGKLPATKVKKKKKNK